MSKKKAKVETFGTFAITAERPVKYVELDVDMDNFLRDKLLKYAKENILKDEEELINWAVVDILKKSIEDPKNKKKKKRNSKCKS